MNIDAYTSELTITMRFIGKNILSHVFCNGCSYEYPHLSKLSPFPISRQNCVKPALEHNSSPLPCTAARSPFNTLACQAASIHQLLAHFSVFNFSYFKVQTMSSAKRRKKKPVKDRWLSGTSTTTTTKCASGIDRRVHQSNIKSKVSKQPIENSKQEYAIKDLIVKYKLLDDTCFLAALMPFIKEEPSGFWIKYDKSNEGVKKYQSPSDGLGTNNDSTIKKVQGHSDVTKPVHSMKTVAEKNKDSCEAQISVLNGTTIIVNSSLCTVQRTVVLEDGKPVELLLEPAKTNVKVGNIYLGVVRKLLPSMGAAFVDIGDKKFAFMAMWESRKPFSFPGSKVELSGESSESSECRLSDQLIENIVEEELSISSVVGLDDYEDIQYSFKEGNNNEGEAADPENKNTLKNANDTEKYATDVHSSQKTESSTSNQKECITADWIDLRAGTRIIVQVIREALQTKGPTVTAFPCLASRFMVLQTRRDRVSVSQKIQGDERLRLKTFANNLKISDFGLIVRSVAEGRTFQDLSNDLSVSLELWENIIKKAEAAIIESDKGIVSAVPTVLNVSKGQTLSVVQDLFNDKVQRMVVDSQNTYSEVTNYLQAFSPDLVNRVELYKEKSPIFDKFGVENVVDHILSERVHLPNGAYMIIQQTEALVAIDVNGGSGALTWNKEKEQSSKLARDEAALEINLSAARQVVKELRLRDIGGIIIVDFIDMEMEKNKRMVYDEVKKAVENDRSRIKFSEISDLGVMEMTRKRVRPSVAFKITEPCSYCKGCGRVETLDTTFSKIERAICHLLAKLAENSSANNVKNKARVLLQVDHKMHSFLANDNNKRMRQLSEALNVLIVLKERVTFTRGQFEVTMSDEKNSFNYNTHNVVDNKIAKGQKKRHMKAKAKGNPVSNS